MIFSVILLHKAAINHGGVYMDPRFVDDDASNTRSRIGVQIGVGDRVWLTKRLTNSDGLRTREAQQNAMPDTEKSWEIKFVRGGQSFNDVNTKCNWWPHTLFLLLFLLFYCTDFDRSIFVCCERTRTRARTLTSRRRNTQSIWNRHSYLTCSTLMIHPPQSTKQYNNNKNTTEQEKKMPSVLLNPDDVARWNEKRNKKDEDVQLNCVSLAIHL